MVKALGLILNNTMIIRGEEGGKKGDRERRGGRERRREGGNSVRKDREGERGWGGDQAWEETGENPRGP